MEGFSDIQVFVAVVERGGFSAAARTLGISKSAVSRRITTLEERLGSRLLHRTTRKLNLTEAGEHFYSHAARAVAALQDAEDAVNQFQGEPRGRLRISVPTSFGRLHLARLIPQFLRRYPLIRMEMTMDDRVSDLIEGGADIAIRGGDLNDSSLIARKLTSFRSMICASSAYLEEKGRPQNPSDLKDHNCLLFSYSAEANHWSFTDEMGMQTIEVTGNYRVNNSEALREAALQGLGIARLPGFVALEEITSGRLEQLLPKYLMPQKALHAVYLKREYMPRKVKVFIEFMEEHLHESKWDSVQ